MAAQISKNLPGKNQPDHPDRPEATWAGFHRIKWYPRSSNAVAAMDDGDYTSVPVQTQFGWHVILREESRDSEPPTLESVREVITQQVQQNKLQAHIASFARSGKTIVIS